jgi:predicted permease
MRRRHEFGVRLATGASRRRLVQQLFTEGLLLALIAGLLGLLIASASWRFFGVQLTNTLLEPAPDGTVIAFAAAISVFGMAIFSAFPALDASRIPLLSALRGGTALGGEGRGSLGSRGWLTAVQLALCLPLMVGAGLLIQTVDNLFSQDMGMDRSQRIKAQLNLTLSGYDGERARPILDQLLSSLQSQPGVESVGYSAFGTLGASYAVDSEPLEGTADAATTGFAWFTLVSEGYFESLGIPLLTGRDFSSRDVDGAPRVTIVNEAFARKFFAGRSPIGLRIHDAEVVGMVADAKYSDLRSDPEPQYYLAYRQSRWALPQMSIYARTPMSVEDFSTVIRSQVGRLDPYLLVDGIETMDGLVEGRLTEERAMSTLLTTFGLLALVISAIGLYGVISLDVTRRTREVGLRKALGARSTDIFTMVFRRAAPWVLGGCIVGLAGAAAMTRLLEAKLFGVAPLDPLTFASAAAFLLLCAAAANYLPARRAAAVEPMTALRHD